ncbi:redoxin domain-containing protein [Halobellus ordinarius]|uniref:redoxin domain-containing protein n=1 Tax=Halobellus ordinarius TaxID=3075120 RepID=UPI002880A648|nr:redoxin domain-containing protein [Halobellus sp. ZY16]
MIDQGATAPEFSLPGIKVSAEDGTPSTYRLSDALEDGPVFLNFYVFDFHPKCTENLCDLHDVEWFGLEESVTVFGVSTDGSFSHRAFAAEQGLDYALLSDGDGSVAEAYDVLYEEFKGHKRVAKRAVFLIDTDRTVRYAWSTDDPSRQPNWTEIEAALSPLIPSH